MATDRSTELCWMLTPEQLGDSLALRRIRADNGFLSVYDVIRWITGQDLHACRMI